MINDRELKELVDAGVVGEHTATAIRASTHLGPRMPVMRTSSQRATPVVRRATFPPGKNEPIPLSSI